MGNKYIMRNCYWCNEYQDMNATVPTCDYYGQYGSCPCSDECEHHISEQEVENIIRKRTETEKMRDWIPCSERLPDVGQTVLASWGDLWNGAVVFASRYCEDDWEWAYEQGADYWQTENTRPEAWMPLPKPYREDGEEEPGQWQTEDGRKTKAEYSVYCSKCGSWSEYRTKYCGNCGSLMKEENDDK